MQECSQDSRKEKEEQEELAKKEKDCKGGSGMGSISELMHVKSLALSGSSFDLLSYFQIHLSGFISMSDM